MSNLTGKVKRAFSHSAYLTKNFVLESFEDELENTLPKALEWIIMSGLIY